MISRSSILRDNELNLGEYGYELIDPDVVLHFPFMDGTSLTLFRGEVERTAATIEAISKADAGTFRRVAAARKGLAGMSAAAAAKTRMGVYFQRLSAMSGHAAAHELWESRYLRAASLSSGRILGPSGSQIGTGAQAFALITHMA